MSNLRNEELVYISHSTKHYHQALGYLLFSKMNEITVLVGTKNTVSHTFSFHIYNFPLTLSV